MSMEFVSSTGSSLSVVNLFSNCIQVFNSEPLSSPPILEAYILMISMKEPMIWEKKTMPKTMSANATSCSLGVIGNMSP